MPRIFSSEIKPGSQVSDFVLSRCLGMSRTPIRSAIMRLISDGIVEINADGGFRVIELDKKLVDSYYNAKALLYPVLLEASIESGISSANIESLANIADSIRNSALENDEKSIAMYIGSFNEAIYSLFSNQMVKASLRSIELLGKLIATIPVNMQDGMKENSYGLLDLLIKALSSGDKATAVDSYKKLISIMHECRISTIEAR